MAFAFASPIPFNSVDSVSASAVLISTGPANAQSGMQAISSMQPFTIPVGDSFVGRIVDVLGRPLDGRGKIESDSKNPVFCDAPGVLDREPIEESFETGLQIIDATIPVGKGQRELIVGDQITNKTSLCLDTIINQKGKDVICIYCYIGGAHSTLMQSIELLKAKESLEAARVLLDTGHADVSASRSYYTMFYLAEALLWEEGEEFRKHGAVHAKFGERFVQSGKINAAFHRYLLDAFDLRILSDYDVGQVVSKEAAEELIRRAKEFLQVAQELLKE